VRRLNSPLSALVGRRFLKRSNELPGDADAIYRLGQYAVYLRYDRLKMILEMARAKKREAAE